MNPCSFKFNDRAGKLISLVKVISSISWLLFWSVFPVSASAVKLGIVDLQIVDLQRPAQSQAYDEWGWALNGGGAKLIDLQEIPARDRLDTLDLLIVERSKIPDQRADTLKKWIYDGGIVILSGPETIGIQMDESGDPNSATYNAIASLAGLKYQFVDPGLRGAYPYLVKSDPLLSPFMAGDGIRFGDQGIDNQVHLQATSADVLATAIVIQPGPGELTFELNAPLITARAYGAGKIVYVNFSLARIAACYTDQALQANDCSAAGTAHGLMRILVANLLWEQKKIPVPLRWETPGDTPVGMVVTGDVHGDDENFQIQSALQMAEILEPLNVPVTYYVTEKAAVHAASQYAELKQKPGVEIAPHPKLGKVRGASHTSARISQEEQVLGIPSWPGRRTWRSSIRTHGWASSQSRTSGWTGMNRAGIGLVLDCNGDWYSREPQWTAPHRWFTADVRKRIFIPFFEKNIHTAGDDFILDHQAALDIASICSPEPDPCCNLTVDFTTYCSYIENWHNVFRRLSSMGGLTTVWLWHPSTPAWKNGFGCLRDILERMTNSGRVVFYSADEIAAWNNHRRRWQVLAKWDSSHQLTGLTLKAVGGAETMAAPPGFPPSAARIGFWVLGPASVPGWSSRTWKDPYGRTVTVLTRPLPITVMNQQKE